MGNSDLAAPTGAVPVAVATVAVAMDGTDPAVTAAAVPSAAGGDQDDIVDEFAYITFDNL